MALSEGKLRAYMKRLLLARMRLLCSHGFYGLLLMHMVYSLDAGADTAYTDGARIAFNPEFLENLSDRELDFVMMHEILHVALRHCFRAGDRDPERYNVAADIVVNSILLEEGGGDLRAITLSRYGEAMHLAPDGKEGRLYTAEEVYEMLPAAQGDGRGTKAGQGRGAKSGRGSASEDRWDDHTHWGGSEDGSLEDVWVKRFADACEAIEIRDPGNARGTLPRFARRLLGKLRRPQLDWRSILSDFVQEEINDYSFSPPDRRFPDSPFFLPDFNEKGEGDEVEDILFMIDTSGSVSDEMMTAAWSEIRGAMEQFGGKLRGWLGFFDAAIVEPQPFSDVEEFNAIRPAGGGGTDFEIIFSYVDRYMGEHPPASIIILTDGYAPFPKESRAGGIPVLWLLNNDEVDPPWGKVARIRV